MCHGSVLSWAATVITPDMVTGVDVIEVGSYDVNGTVRPTVTAHGPASYIGVDIEAGPGVDLIANVEDLPTLYPGGFGLVISTEMLEHVEDWRKAFTALATIVKPGGNLIISTRSPGFMYHPYPVDNWRYPVDTTATIIEALGLTVTTCIPDPQAAGVFAIASKPAQWKKPKRGTLDNIIIPGPLE